jgi:hypothetical protein
MGVRKRRENTMAQSNIDSDIKLIAADTDTPPETVSKMYKDTWAQFSEGAHVTDYIGIIVAKHVRAILRLEGGHGHSAGERHRPNAGK